MSQFSVDLRQHIRKAFAFEEKAHAAEGKSAALMVSAGAELWAGFVLVMTAAGNPPPKESSKLEKWYAHSGKAAWDEALRAEDKSRDSATRLIQWHLNPSAAQKRHLAERQRLVQLDEKRKKNRGVGAHRDVGRISYTTPADEYEPGNEFDFKSRLFELTRAIAQKAAAVQDEQAIGDAIDVLESVLRDLENAARGPR